MTYICINKPTSICSDNGLSYDRCQAIISTSAGILLIGPVGTNFSEILIGIQNEHFHSRKCIWKCRVKNGGHFVWASMCQWMWYWKDIDKGTRLNIFCCYSSYYKGAIATQVWYKQDIDRCSFICCCFQSKPLRPQITEMNWTKKLKGVFRGWCEMCFVDRDTLPDTVRSTLLGVNCLQTVSSLVTWHEIRQNIGSTYFKLIPSEPLFSI